MSAVSGWAIAHWAVKVAAVGTFAAGAGLFIHRGDAWMAACCAFFLRDALAAQKGE